MDAEELKRALQDADLGHLDDAASAFAVPPMQMLAWISGEKPIPHEVAERALRLAALHAGGHQQ